MGASERMAPAEQQQTPAEEAAAAAARLKEKQLSETRKGRKEAESVHQVRVLSSQLLPTRVEVSRALLLRTRRRC